MEKVTVCVFLVVGSRQLLPPCHNFFSPNSNTERKKSSDIQHRAASGCWGFKGFLSLSSPALSHFTDEVISPGGIAMFSSHLSGIIYP